MASKSGRAKFSDLRYMFMRGLIGYERAQRRKHYLKSAAEWTSNAIVSLELAEKPIKSVPQAGNLFGVGGEITKKLKEIRTKEEYDSDPPPKGRFVSSAGALLVAMLNLKEEAEALESSESEPILIPEQTLKTEAQRMCEEKFVPTENTDAFCMASWRLHVLCNKDYIKKRSLNKQPVYQLLAMGEEVARRLRGDRVKKTQKAQVTVTRGGGDQVASMREGGDQTGHEVEEMEALYTNDDGRDGVVLLVDTCEWGGDRGGLAQLINFLEQTGIRYKTKRLDCGDYSWYWRCGDDEITLPLLVERKRVDDLAKSLVDRRYLKQKDKMRAWKSVFAGHNVEASLKYMVEGEPEQYVVRCPDGCRGVGKCGNPTVEQLKVTLQELEDDTEFDLLRTENIENTVNLLAVMTIELQQRLDSGDFDHLLTMDINLKAPAENSTACITNTSKGPKSTGNSTTKRNAKNTKQFHVPPSEKLGASHWADELSTELATPTRPVQKSKSSKNILPLAFSELSDDDDDENVLPSEDTHTGALNPTAEYSHLSETKETAKSGTNIEKPSTSGAKLPRPHFQSTSDDSGYEEVPDTLMTQYHCTRGMSINNPLINRPKKSNKIEIQEGILPTVRSIYKPPKDDRITANSRKRTAFDTSLWNEDEDSILKSSDSKVPSPSRRNVTSGPKFKFTPRSEYIETVPEAASSPEHVTRSKGRMYRMKMKSSPSKQPKTDLNMNALSVGQSSQPPSSLNKKVKTDTKSMSPVSMLDLMDSQDSLPDLDDSIPTHCVIPSLSKIPDTGDLPSVSSTGASRNDNVSKEIQEKVETIKAILPHLKESKILSTLNNLNFHVESAVSELLDGGSQESQESVVDLTDSQTF